MNKALSIAVVVLVIGGFAVLLSQAQPADVPEGETYSEELVEYFQNQMWQVATDKSGAMPIEGYDAQLLMGAYPELVKEDFDGVESFEGIYEIKDGELTWSRVDSEMITSAERTISTEGYGTLLANLSERLNIMIGTESDVDALIDDLDKGEQLTLSIGEEGGALDITLTPVEVVEDSRCPVDVECIQAGMVFVKTEIVSGLGTSTMDFELHSPITTEAEKITLVKVEPNKVSTQEIEESEYKFTYYVEKRK